MKKRLLALVTALALVMGLCPTALAAGDGGARETHYFTDQEHADLDFEDMEYVHMELADIQAQIDAVRALIGDITNTLQAQRLFAQVTDTIEELRTMAILLTIKKSQDIEDEWAAEEFLYVQELQIDAFEAYYFLMKDILDSPCAVFLRPQLSNADVAFLKAFQGISQEETDRALRETELEDRYYAAIAAQGSYPVEVADGVVTTLADATADMYAALQYYLILGTEEAYDDYLATYDIYVLAFEGDLRALNAACGEIFLELVALRDQTAREAGYANYLEYAYARIYKRDYAPGEIRSFEAAVKEHIPEINSALAQLVEASSDSPVHFADYTGENAFDLMRPYVGLLSSEVEEAFDYMMDHHLYDYGYGEGTKDGSGFTTVLPSYGAPFTFNTPSGTLYDFSTAVHEFGHYDRYYWTPQGLFDYTDDIDQAEVHSQGMELMFTQFYDDIFGQDSETVLDFLMYNLTRAMMDGCLQDEFQQFAYTTPGLSLDELNEEFHRLCLEYGDATEDDDGNGYYTYGWVLTHHTFDQPCYYISYATSVSGAFSFWLDAQENGYEDAVDTYLIYASLPAEMGLREGLGSAGVDDPLTAEYVEQLSSALWTALDIDRQLYYVEMDPLYTDVDHTQWFAEAVWEMTMSGIMSGMGDGTFAPEGTATRAQAVTVLWNFMGNPENEAGSFTDVTRDDWFAQAVDWASGAQIVSGTGGGRFSPSANVTREQFAVMLYHLATANGLTDGAVGTALSGYADAGQVSIWASEAMSWAIGAGILTGKSGSLLAPGSDIKRAEMATMIQRFIDYTASVNDQ